MKEQVNCGDCERICSGGNSTSPVESLQQVENHLKNNQEDLETSPKTSEVLDCQDLNEENASKQENEGPIVNEENNVNSLSRLTTESIDSKDEKNDNFTGKRIQESLEHNGKIIDEEPRFLYSDNASIKSRSLSLTSNCSLFVTVPNDGEYKILFEI